METHPGIRNKRILAMIVFLNCFILNSMLFGESRCRMRDSGLFIQCILSSITQKVSTIASIIRSHPIVTETFEKIITFLHPPQNHTIKIFSMKRKMIALSIFKARSISQSSLFCIDIHLKHGMNS